MADEDKEEISAEDWASALAEQETQPAGDDEWSAALSEQENADKSEPAPAPAEASAAQASPARLFEQFSQESAPQVSGPANLDMILDIPVNLTVELGRTKIAIRSLLQLAQGSVVELEGLAGEPMDVLVNGCLIAQGEVVVVNDKFGIRLTDIISPSERLRRIHR